MTANQNHCSMGMTHQLLFKCKIRKTIYLNQFKWFAVVILFIGMTSTEYLAQFNPQ